MLGFFKKLFGGSLNDMDKFLKEGAFLVDVRTSQEFQRGSVKGAINIPLNEIKSNLEKFKSKKNIIVFCQSGARSGQAKRILTNNGMQNVINGGGWRNVDDAVKNL